jgi:Tfp pilus assembly protein PilF
MFAKKAVLLTLLLLFWSSVPSPGQSAPGPQAPGGPDEAQQHWLLAERYIAEQKPELAIPELEKVVALDPKNVDAQANLGVLLFFHGDFKAAVPQLQAAVSRQPGLWKIQALLGLAEGRLQEADASRADLEAAFPHLTEAGFQLDVGKALVDNYVQAGDLEKAADTVNGLLATRPTDASLLYLSYRLYSDLSGQAMLTLALAAPKSAEMYLAMAHQQAQHNDNTMAITNLRKALQIDPRLSDAHTELGELLYNSTDVKLRAGAQAEFEAALAVNPQDEKAQLAMGIIMEKNGDLKTAYADDSRALELNPNDSDACAELARVLVEMNRQEEAQQMLERALKIDPGNYTAHYRLATLYRREGKTEEVKQQLAEYQKYKDMHDKLTDIFHNMRVISEQPHQDNDDAGSGLIH